LFAGKRIVTIIPAFDEEKKIVLAIKRIPRDIVDTVLVVDDGSSDQTAPASKNLGAEVVSLGQVYGVGYAIREGLAYAQKNNFDIATIMAGNNKDDPDQISLLLKPIVENGMDFVQGSRYLPGGEHGGDMPIYRRWATRLHPFLMSCFTGKKITDSTNGFRAINLSVLQNPAINLQQQWLNEYELEPYLYYKIITLGYKFCEVPVRKIYPPRQLGNTKMKPIIGWWSILRPLFCLRLGLKK
jgi:dolichol-phosphate mannosyltransferase